MKIEELNTTLKDIIENKRVYRSVLVDGKWGCGKTTAVNDALKTIKKSRRKRIYYQSVYGIKGINDLGICFKTNRKIKLAAKGISPLFKFVPIIGKKIYKHLEFAIDPSNETLKIKRNSIFIFDDIERTDKNFSYIALLGFFNQLLLNRCQIICISSLSDLYKFDSKRASELGDFIEKSFDRILEINEQPSSIIQEIFDKDGIKITQEAINEFDSNIRLAKRAKNLLVNILKSEKEEKYNISDKFTINQLVYCSIAVVKSMYLDIFQHEDREKEHEYITTYGLDSNIVLKINETINKTKSIIEEEKAHLYDLAKAMAYYERFNDFSLLNRFYCKNEEKNPTILESESFYLLNDADKEKYISSFIEETKKSQLNYDRWFGDRLVELLQEDSFRSNSEFIEFLIHDLVNKNNGAIERIGDYVEFDETKRNKEIIEDFKNKIDNLKHANEIQNLLVKIKNSYDIGDYNYLNEIIHDANSYKMASKKYLLNALIQNLIENNFYLPCFSNSLSMNEWHYCHNVATFAQTNNLKNEFFSVLLNQYRNNKNDKSAKSKIKSIVVYRFSADEFNEQFQSLDS